MKRAGVRAQNTLPQTISCCCGFSTPTQQLAPFDSLTTRCAVHPRQASEDKNDQMVQWNGRVGGGGGVSAQIYHSRRFLSWLIWFIISILRGEFSQAPVLSSEGHVSPSEPLRYGEDFARGLAKIQMLSLPSFPQHHHSNSNPFNKHMTFWPFHCFSSERSIGTEVTNSSTQRVDQSFFHFVLHKLSLSHDLEANGKSFQKI